MASHAQVYVGAPKRRNIRPKFQVKKLEGERVVKKIRYSTKKYLKNKSVPVREVYEEKVDAGFLVAFPAGHSIRLRDMNEVRKLGFDQDAELVDMDTGEVIERQAPVDLFSEASRRAGMEAIA